MNFGETILDILASSPINQISINGLSKKLKKRGFSGDYKNTYQKIMWFEKEGILSTKQIGKSKLLSINYTNSITIPNLAKMELSKKITLMKKNPSFNKILFELTQIKSEFILLTNPQKNLNLNRIELLILTESPLTAIKQCSEIEQNYSIRIDCLALKNKEFTQLIKSNSFTITEMFYNKLILLNQEKFFELNKKLLINTYLNKKKYSLLDLNESELRFNLSKLGYLEFGKEETNKELSIEEIILTTLLNGTARQKTALKSILEKKEFNPQLLAFLIKKYSKQKEILNLIRNKKETKLKELIILTNIMKEIIR